MNTPTLAEPVALKKPHPLEKHGDVRIDDYYWMNERDHPEVIAYLHAENEYYRQFTAHTQHFRTALFEEMKARIKEDDSSVPYFYNGYWYIIRYEKNKDYPIYTRKKGTLDAEEELLFDANKMAEGTTYFKLKGINVSDDNKWAAFAVDTVSRREYVIRIKNLETGEILPDAIEKTTGNSTWAADNKTLFYSRQHAETLRPEKILKHSRGSHAQNDQEVYHEKDETFTTFVYRSQSKKYIIIGSGSTLTTEYQILKADRPNDDFKVFQPRERGLEYAIAHFDDSFYIVTNKDGATNFKLMKTREEQTTKDYWQEVIPHRKEVLLEGIDIFKDYLVISERSNGLTQIKIQPWHAPEKAYYLSFPNETYTAYTSINLDFDTTRLRFAFQSMATPASVMEIDMDTREQRVLKEQEVLGSFHKTDYEEVRLWAVAQDGTWIPVSMVYKKGIKKNGKNPLLLYAYGSYGATMDPYFSSTRLSLLDRGFIYAIAHVRGGEELGRAWYENGKLLQKKNTFTDFIDCSRFLIANKYTSPEHLYAEGGSAGGLLIGAVVNMAPELYKGVIAQVPFVDVVTTMLDDSIPLTTGEYDEWGDPNEKMYYDYMKSYSPYDNVAARNYPNILVTTGLHDSQVQYWEPAKWVAKLRELKTDRNKLLFRINMDAGHGGASGRFDSLKETAEDYAFLLDLEGKAV